MRSNPCTSSTGQSRHPAFLPEGNCPTHSNNPSYLCKSRRVRLRKLQLHPQPHLPLPLLPLQTRPNLHWGQGYELEM